MSHKKIEQGLVPLNSNLNDEVYVKELDNDSKLIRSVSEACWISVKGMTSRYLQCVIRGMKFARAEAESISCAAKDIQINILLHRDLLVIPM